MNPGTFHYCYKVQYHLRTVWCVCIYEILQTKQVFGKEELFEEWTLVCLLKKNLQRDKVGRRWLCPRWSEASLTMATADGEGHQWKWRLCSIPAESCVCCWVRTQATHATCHLTYLDTNVTNTNTLMCTSTAVPRSQCSDFSLKWFS